MSRSCWIRIIVGMGSFPRRALNTFIINSCLAVGQFDVSTPVGHIVLQPVQVSAPLVPTVTLRAPTKKTIATQASPQLYSMGVFDFIAQWVESLSAARDLNSVQFVAGSVSGSLGALRPVAITAGKVVEGVQATKSSASSCHPFSVHSAEEAAGRHLSVGEMAGLQKYVDHMATVVIIGTKQMLKEFENSLKRGEGFTWERVVLEFRAFGIERQIGCAACCRFTQAQPLDLSVPHGCPTRTTAQMLNNTINRIINTGNGKINDTNSNLLGFVCSAHVGFSRCPRTMSCCDSFSFGRRQIIDM